MSIEALTDRPTSAPRVNGVMKALVSRGPGQRAWENKPGPTIRERGDAIVRITRPTIHGTDLHILEGDVPSVTPGRILGHEGVVFIEATDPSVSCFSGRGRTYREHWRPWQPVESHLEKPWDCNIALTTRLVDTVSTPLLLKLVQTGKLRPAGLVTHRFGLDDIMRAYDTFADAATKSALKVVLKGREPD